MSALIPSLSLALRAAAVLCAALAFAACSSEIDDKPAASVGDAVADTPAAPVDEPASAPATAASQLSLDPAQSAIEFVGAKVTGDHRGSFPEAEGTLDLAADGSVDRVWVQVQMASLVVEPERLLNHLKSGDFFEVETYPTAVFELDELREEASENGTHRVAGELELRGTRKRIEFPARVEFGPDAVVASAEFTIDRQDFGIVYPGRPDDLIRDEVLLDIELHFPRG